MSVWERLQVGLRELVFRQELHNQLQQRNVNNNQQDFLLRATQYDYFIAIY